MKRINGVWMAAAIVVLTVATAFAEEAVAEHGGAHGGGEQHINFTDFILRLVNFVLFIGIIWWFAGKKIKEFFGGRKNQIRRELDDLDTRRKEAEAKLKNVEKSIANIEQERQSIIDEAVKQGESMKASLVEQGKNKADHILAQAQVAIETERNVAMQGLRTEMAEMIVEAAEKILKERLTEEEHQKLMDEYVKRVVLN